MDRLIDFSPFDWISSQLGESRDNLKKEGLSPVEICPALDAYCKVLHPIWVKPELHHFSEAGEASRLVGRLVGEDPDGFPKSGRIYWRDLLALAGKGMGKDVNDLQLTDALGGALWPKFLQGPQEGNYGEETCQRLVETLTPFTHAQTCYFYYASYATRSFYEDVLYQGSLAEVPSTLTMVELGSTPTFYWPQDKSWCLHSD